MSVSTRPTLLLWQHLVLAAFLAVHLSSSVILFLQAFALGEARIALPISMQVGLGITGFPVLWPVYLGSFIWGFSVGSVYLLLALMLPNSLLCLWMLKHWLLRYSAPRAQTI